MHRYVLGNGLVVLAHKGRFDKSHVTLCTKAGMRHDPPERCGLAHLVEHLYLTRPDQLSIIESLGCSTNGSTYGEYQSYECTLPHAHLARFLRVLHEELLCKTYARDHLENERRAVLIEAEETLDSPNDRCRDKLYSMVHGVGSCVYETQGVRAITLQDIVRFKESYFAANNMVLVVVGKNAERTVKKIAEDVFGGIPTKPIVPLPKKGGISGSTTVHKQVRLAYLVGGKECVGPDHPDFFPLEAAVHVLYNPDLWTSRMFRTLRLEHGLVYSPEAKLELECLGKGYVSWEASCRPENVGKVKECVAEVMRCLGSQGVSRDEWSRTRQGMLSDLSDNVEDPEEYAKYILTHELWGHPLPYKYKEIIQKLTADQIRDAAAKHLVGGYHTVRVLPKPAIARPCVPHIDKDTSA